MCKYSNYISMERIRVKRVIKAYWAQNGPQTQNVTGRIKDDCYINLEQDMKIFVRKKVIRALLGPKRASGPK